MPATDGLERTVRAVIDAFRPSGCPVSAGAATQRALDFLATFRASGSPQVKTVDMTLGVLRAALTGTDGSREATRQRLTAMDGSPLRPIARFAQGFSTAVLYATLDDSGRPLAAQAIGYDVFADRPRGRAPVIPPEPRLPASAIIGPGDRVPDDVYDAVIVGSGAAGSVMAARLIARGWTVALVEAGEYVPERYQESAPTRPRPHDELDNVLAFYKDAGLQLTDGTCRMSVVQGQCVGGSSIINNAVCFRMPGHVRETWARDFGAHWAVNGELDAAYDRIASDLHIAPVTAAVPEGWINPSARFLASGASALGRADALRPCAVNVEACLGCGYCNLGCAYLRKRTVLQALLPGAAATGRLRVFTGRRAREIMVRVPAYRAEGVMTEPTRGSGERRAIRGRRVVVSAGAVASSAVLGRTSALFPLGLPVGERFSLNLVSPVYAEYATPVRAFDGIQMGHYYAGEMPSEDFVIETWFSPPAMQAMSLPGWMDELDANLQRYAHYACASPLVASTAGSKVDTRFQPERIWLQLTDGDLQRLKRGLTRTCELFFNGTPTPRRALIGALTRWELTPDTYRAHIEAIKSFDDILVTSAHPQGGNSVSADGRGVVRPDFRVRDARDLYVVDASVFPTSLGVNPQWTVMALADVASRYIAA